MDERDKDHFRSLSLDQMKRWMVVEMWGERPHYLSTEDYEWIVEELIEKVANL